MTRRWWAGVLALVALIGAAGFVTWGLASQEPTVGIRPSLAQDGEYTPGTVPDAPRAAVQAAVDAVPIALSYDYTEPERTVTAAASRMTADFAEEFRTTFDAAVRPLAEKKQSVSQARVRAAGVVSSSATEVVCLVYVDQVLVSSKALDREPQPLKVGQTRVSVRMVKVGDSWKVDDLSPL